MQRSFRYSTAGDGALGKSDHRAAPANTVRLPSKSGTRDFRRRSGIMSIQHTARSGKTYYLHVTPGKGGKVAYYSEFYRSVTMPWISLDTLHEGARRSASYQAVMRFVLVDWEKRLFSVERFCFRGSVEDWISISTE